MVSLADHSESPLACLQCRQSKRRCDRVYPECTLCTQKRVRCHYPNSRKTREYRSTAHESSLGIHDDSISRSPSGTPLSGQSAQPGMSAISSAELLATRFLDSNVFYCMKLDIPRPEVPLNKSMQDMVGNVVDIQETAKLYFDTVHTWMPIISKVQFNENLLSRLSQRRSEFFLLILSMKLSCARVTVPNSVLYRMVKQLHFDMESAGVLSVPVLQSSILITLYEMGHAMYPAVLFSVGQCSRYSTVLGINDRARPPDEMNLPWIEVEECCRIWWATVILDRFLNLCSPSRHLVTPDPSPNTYLPVDDAAWDAGTSRPEDAVTIKTSYAPNLARYARFAQAAHLLTHALAQSTEDPSSTMQLQRTILSLVTLAETEGSWKRWGLCTQIAILLIEKPNVYRNNNSVGLDAVPVELSPIAVAALQAALDMVTHFAVDTWTCYRTSPFFSHFLYTAASIYLRSTHANPGGPDEEKLHVLKQALRLVNNRWLAAGMYLSLLDRREAILLTQDAASYE